MNDKAREQFEPTVTPPNGERVTAAALYKALFELDQGMSRRQTVIFEAINDGNDRTAQLRTDLEAHREDGHPFTEQAAITKQELKLDVKRIGLLAAIFAFMTALAGAAGAYAPMLLGG